MSDSYSEEHQRKGKTDYEFLKDRMRNYFTSVISYFELKKKLDNNEIPSNLKEDIENLLNKLEKKCHKNVEKIKDLLEGD